MIKFQKPIPYHLNVGQSDRLVCIGLLKLDQWNPASSCMENALASILAALAQPQADSFVDDDVNNNYIHLYQQRAKRSVKFWVYYTM